MDTRQMAVLLGGAVGDALGTTREFSAGVTDPQGRSFSKLLTGPHVEVLGGGPFHVAPGQVTDDTQMAIALWESLRANGRYDARDVATRYLEWQQYAFDVGGQTGRSLNTLRGILAADASYAEPWRAGIAMWEHGGKQAAGNGSLMRTWPLPVFFGMARFAEMIEATVKDSVMTHADPRCILSCAAYNTVIAALLEGQTPEKAIQRAVIGAMTAQDFALSDPDLGAFEAEFEEAFAAVRQDVARAHDDDPRLYGEEGLSILATQGFVRVAFRLAMWYLLHAPSFEAGLIDTVNRGGDADTNGAIVGALLGARFGFGAIPAQWVDTVVQSEPAAPWDKQWHPRTFLEEAK